MKQSLLLCLTCLTARDIAQSVEHVLFFPPHGSRSSGQLRRRSLPRANFRLRLPEGRQSVATGIGAVWFTARAMRTWTTRLTSTTAPGIPRMTTMEAGRSAWRRCTGTDSGFSLCAIRRTALLTTAPIAKQRAEGATLHQCRRVEPGRPARGRADRQIGNACSRLFGGWRRRR